MSQEKTDVPEITIGEVYKMDGHRAVDIMIDGRKVGMSYVDFGAGRIGAGYANLLERAGGVEKVRQLIKDQLG